MGPFLSLLSFGIMNYSAKGDLNLLPILTAFIQSSTYIFLVCMLLVLIIIYLYLLSTSLGVSSYGYYQL